MLAEVADNPGFAGDTGMAFRRGLPPLRPQPKRTGTDIIMADRTCLAVVLAAGEGTRMRSARPKVMHTIGGQSLLSHVLPATRARKPARS